MHDSIPTAVPPVDFPKLREVVIERGYIRGLRPESTDANGWWNPLELYYRANRGSERPYVAFYKYDTDNASVKRFAETYGLIQQVPGEGGRTASYSLAEFQFERWHFHLAVSLHGFLKNPDRLREVFSKALGDIEKNLRSPKPSLWIDVARKIWNAVVRDGGLSQAANLGDIRERIREAGDARIIAAAKTYTSQVVWKHLERTRLWLEYEEDGSSRLSVSPPDLLTAFYFMLATDWATDSAPVMCGYCGRVFQSERKNAAYCSRLKCKRKGPLKTSWARHGADYVRTRKEKRRKARLRKGLN